MILTAPNITTFEATDDPKIVAGRVKSIVDYLPDGQQHSFRLSGGRYNETIGVGKPTGQSAWIIADTQGNQAYGSLRDAIEAVVQHCNSPWKGDIAKDDLNASSLFGNVVRTNSSAMGKDERPKASPLPPKPSADDIQKYNDMVGKNAGTISLADIPNLCPKCESATVVDGDYLCQNCRGY